MKWVGAVVCLVVGSGLFFGKQACAARERVLRGPASMRTEQPVLPEVGRGSETEYSGQRLRGPGRHALALTLSSAIFDRTGRGRMVVGAIRRGNVMRVRRTVPRVRCWEGGKAGRWYELFGGGFVCSARDFVVGTRLPKVEQRQPDTSALLPYTYARVRNRGAIRFKRQPDVRAVQNPAASSVESERLFGDYLVAMDAIEEIGGERFVRTVRGHYVREDDLEPFEVPAMHGELLGKKWKLPLAFVYDKDAPLYCLEDRAELCGRAEKHARFPVKGSVKVAGRKIIRGEGIGVEEKRVRIARPITRPRGVERSAKWVHVDLSEQTLVAYQGDAPVFATLVSTGKKGFTTPTGLYRTDRKVLTRTMRGRDPVDGVYDVEEVPWVLYYLRGYALHGAYWHDDFGKVRSHGCTNIAPPDARWLFDWASHKLPEGWHRTNKGPGMHVYFTR